MITTKKPNLRAWPTALSVILLAVGVVFISLLFLGHSKQSSGTSSTAVPGGSTPEPMGSPISDAEIKALRASVVRVRAIAPSCGRQAEASGFAYAPERVLTTADLVAGSREPVAVIANNGARRWGTVVVFDPSRNVAVLKVPKLHARAFDPRSVEPGERVTIMGYTAGAVLTVTSAEVQSRSVVLGPDIHSVNQVRREVVRLHVQEPLKPGLSGSPVIGADGRLAGMIFARAYVPAGGDSALSVSELRPPMADGLEATVAMSTQQCSG